MSKHAQARMRAIKAEAGRLSNFTGDDVPLLGEDTDFYGDEGFSHATGGGRGRGVMETLDVVIRNTDPNNTLLCPVFSSLQQWPVPYDTQADQEGTVPTAATGLTLEYKGYDTLNELYGKLLTDPFNVGRIRYGYGDETQLKYQWKLYRKEHEGTHVQPLKPQLLKQASDNLGTFLNGKMDFYVDKFTTLFVPIAPAFDAATPREVTISFYKMAELNPDRLMRKQGGVRTFQTN